MRKWETGIPIANAELRTSTLSHQLRYQCSTEFSCR